MPSEKSLSDQAADVLHQALAMPANADQSLMFEEALRLNRLARAQERLLSLAAVSKADGAAP